MSLPTTKEEFDEYLKGYLHDNLSIDARYEWGSYGSADSISITLKLDDEVVSSTWVDLPRKD